ncbi:hypothetical protein [Streptomyces sp. bgisy154]|uniref:hypothetical protein n=1 Tax=Streptomyces sp. bgisy154 TaxID=3413794 RepID=UPI003D737321
MSASSAPPHRRERAPARRRVRGPGGGAWGAAAAVVLADALAGRFHRTGTAARALLVGKPPVDRLTVVFPGFIMAAGPLGAALEPHLRPGEGLLVVQYAERGVDIDRIAATVMDRLRLLAPRRLDVYGASMGGMCAKQFLDRYLAAGQFCGQAGLVLDTAPASAADLRWPTWLLASGRYYHGGPLSSAVWALLSSLTPRPTPEPGADPVVTRRSRRHSAWAGMPAITTQAAYVEAFPPLQAGELTRTAAQVRYVRPRQSEQDSVVRLDSAVAGWRRAFPDLRVTCVPGRKGAWHVPLVERPAELMRAIRGE